MDRYPIFVLTLEGEEERRAPLLARLQELGLEHELFFGVDGRKGLTAAQERLVDRPGTVSLVWKTLRDPEYACALSHQFMYRRVIDRRLPGCVVLEDDAILRDGFADFVRRRGYVGHDVVLLAHHGGLRTRAAAQTLPCGATAVRVATPPMGTMGYALSREAARIIHRRSLPLRAPADWPCNIARLDCVAAVPRLVGFQEDDAASIIAPSRDAVVIPQRFPKLRGLLSLDKWHLRLWSRLGAPIEDE